MTAGIDVSEWQGHIDWPTVAAAGISFAIIRAGDGIRHPDPRFAENWAGAGAAGLDRGAYLFCRTDQDPLQQAAFLAASGADGELAPWADFEAAATSSARPLVWLAAFVAELEQRTGRIPTIYTGPAFWRSLGPASAKSVWAQYPLAIAHYTKKAAPDIPPPWTNHAFWQHTSSGRVPGIGGLVDLDISIAGAITAAPAQPKEHPLVHLNVPVVAIVTNPAGSGYWEVAGDGGVFAFGDARQFPENVFPTQKLNAPVTDASATATGQGLYLGCADGGVLTLGDAQFAGAVPGL